MVWANFDDNYPEHPKVWPLSDAAFRLHVSMVCKSTRLLTDGVVDRSRLVGMVPKYRPALLRELIENGLVHEQNHACESCPQPPEEAVILHDFHDTNRSSQQVKADRAAARDRQARRRSHGARHGVTSDVTDPVSHGVSHAVTSASQATPSPSVLTSEGEQTLVGDSPARPLLRPDAPDTLVDELNALLAILSHQFGDDAVNDAARRLLGERRRFPWPSDARKAIEAMLATSAPEEGWRCPDCGGRPAGAGIAHALDCPQMPSYTDVPNDPDERRAILERVRSSAPPAA